MPSKDPDYNRKWYLAHRDSERRKARERMRARRKVDPDYGRASTRANRRLVQRVARFVGCQHCGTKEKLEYHHPHGRGGDPERKVGNAVRYGRKRLKAEMRKCIVLCASCHTEVHRNG